MTVVGLKWTPAVQLYGLFRQILQVARDRIEAHHVFRQLGKPLGQPQGTVRPRRIVDEVGDLMGHRSEVQVGPWLEVACDVHHLALIGSGERRPGEQVVGPKLTESADELVQMENYDARIIIDARAGYGSDEFGHDRHDRNGEQVCSKYNLIEVVGHVVSEPHGDYLIRVHHLRRHLDACKAVPCR